MTKNIKNFLKEINKMTKLTKVQLRAEDSQLGGDLKNVSFKITLKADPFIEGEDHGLNVSYLFYNTANDLCYKHFGKTATWNNTRQIFWVYSEKI